MTDAQLLTMELALLRERYGFTTFVEALDLLKGFSTSRVFPATAPAKETRKRENIGTMADVGEGVRAHLALQRDTMSSPAPDLPARRKSR